VLVDQLDSRELDADLERSVRVRWGGGETRLYLRVPAELAGPAEDATFFLAALLLPAMRLHEDLEIDAPVSARLLGRLDRIQRHWHAWDLSIRRCEVRTGGPAPAPRSPGEDMACFFSRGVDSSYSATAPRSEPGPLTRLVFIDGIEPCHDDAVRREEIRLAREAAAVIGLPMSVCATNLREFTDAILSWGDEHGAALAGAAGALSGGIRHMVIPATQNQTGMGPYGSSPLVDPLFSTEHVQVEHDELVGRTEKTVWLARERPALLPYLKVCFAENRPDNCGRCGKCAHTMVALEAAGALEQATGFPDEIDAAFLARMRHDGLSARIDWLEVARALPDGPLRRAVLKSLRRSRGRLLRPAWSNHPDSFIRHRLNTVVSLFVKGRPYP
jgi:hypothetical protein